MSAACEEIGSAPTESRGTGSSNPAPPSGESNEPSVPPRFQSVIRQQLAPHLPGIERAPARHQVPRVSPVGAGGSCSALWLLYTMSSSFIVSPLTDTHGSFERTKISYSGVTTLGSSSDPALMTK